MKTSVYFALAGFLGATLMTASAEEGTCRVDVQVVRIPASHADHISSHLVDSSDWNRRIESGEVQVLENGAARGSIRRPGLILVGHKVPIAYADPRTGGSQVQYVDLGFKIDYKVAEMTGGSLAIDTNVSRFEQAAGSTPMSAQDGLRVQAFTLLKPGQVGVLASTRGRLTAQYLKASYPNVVFSENDVILITVTARKI